MKNDIFSITSLSNRRLIKKNELLLEYHASSMTFHYNHLNSTNKIGYHVLPLLLHPLQYFFGIYSWKNLAKWWPSVWTETKVCSIYWNIASFFLKYSYSFYFRIPTRLQFIFWDLLMKETIASRCQFGWHSSPSFILMT